MILRALAVAAILTVGTAQGTYAQNADTARVGQRVRLLLKADNTPGHPRQMLFGELLRKPADSLAVQLLPGTAPVVMPLHVIDRVHVSRGVPTRKQSATGGAIGGAVVGFGFGLLLVLVSDANAWDVVKHTAMDATFGAALGALMPQESWKRVSR